MYALAAPIAHVGPLQAALAAILFAVALALTVYGIVKALAEPDPIPDALARIATDRAEHDDPERTAA